MWLSAYFFSVLGVTNESILGKITSVPGIIFSVPGIIYSVLGFIFHP
jgi:hypothetical protein